MQQRKLNGLMVVIFLLTLVSGGWLITGSAWAATSTEQASNKQDKTSLGYLVTHNYALGAASNFNLFATNNYVQANNVDNARIAANNFQLNNWQKSIGWHQQVDGMDAHMLVVNQLADDANTLSTRLATDQVAGVFAAEADGAKSLTNTAGQSVKPDALSSVTDFADNGLTSFKDAGKQLADLSDFYNSPEQLKATFSSDFLNIVDIPESEIGSGQGIDTTITDSGQHQLLVVNIPVTEANQLRKNYTDLTINIDYITKEKTEPVVILNFPKLTDTLEFYSSNDTVNVTYGPEGDQTQIKDKNHLLLNFNRLSTLGFNNKFVGSVMAPNTDVTIHNLNTNITALAAKNIAVDSSVNADGAQGVFNPTDFSDPKNAADNTAETKKVNATARWKGASGDQSSLSFDQPAVLENQFGYYDATDYYVSWQGYQNAKLYVSGDNQKTWRVLRNGQQSAVSGDGVFDSTTSGTAFYPGRGAAIDQSVADDRITFSTATTRTIDFALATDNPGNSDKAKLWSSSITYNLAPFKLSVPTQVAFDQINRASARDLTVVPKVAPQIVTVNASHTPYRLSVKGDASVAEPKSADQNVFLGSNQFTYRDDELVALMTDAKQLLSVTPTASDAADSYHTGLRAAALNETTSNLNGFQLQVPLVMQRIHASAGLTWQLILAGQSIN